MKPRKIISFVFIVLVLVAWFYYIVKYFDDIYQSLTQIRVTIFLISSLFLAIVYFIAIFNWKYLLKFMGFTMPYIKACRIWFLSNLAKYIPGTIWVPLGRSIYTTEQNISIPKTFLSWILEIYVTILSITFLASILQFFYPAVLPLWKWVPFLILFILLIPFVSKSLSRKCIIFLSKIKYLQKYHQKFDYMLELNSKLKLKKFLVPIILRILIGLIYGVWLLIMVNSIFPNSSISIFYFTYVWSLSWLIAFLVVFLPGGIGLREGLFATFLINAGLSVPIALTISLLTRVQFIIIDGLLGLIFLKEKNS